MHVGASLACLTMLALGLRSRHVHEAKGRKGSARCEGIKRSMPPGAWMRLGLGRQGLVTFFLVGPF